MDNKTKIIMVVTITSLILIFMGITYAWFTTSDNKGSTARISVNVNIKMLFFD